jgi:thiamine phosphate synthase YjbQ (UPF0047 family)
MEQQQITITTNGRKAINITGEINNALGFGIWQGLFLYEHRDGTFKRNLVITCQ